MRQSKALSTGKHPHPETSVEKEKLTVELLKLWVPYGFKKRLKSAAKVRLKNMSEFTRDVLLQAIEAAERKTATRATTRKR